MSQLERDIREEIDYFGEEYGEIVRDSLVWLSNNEPRWGLDIPIDRKKYISNIIKNIQTKPEKKEEEV